MLLNRRNGKDEAAETKPKVSQTSKGGRVVFDVEDFANDPEVEAHFKKAAEWVRRQREMDQKADAEAKEQPAKKPS